MASLFVNTASDYLGYGWFGVGARRGFVMDGGQWRTGWSTLQEDDRSKFGLDPGPCVPLQDIRGDRLINALLDDQSDFDTGTETPEPWGKGRCYREEWFGGGYANVTREQRDRMTRGQFVKDSALSIGCAGTLGKREHDDKIELVGEKRRQAETRGIDAIVQGRLVGASNEKRGDEIGTLGDLRSCAGVLDMDLMTEGFKDEAIVLEKYGRCAADLVNDRAVLDWGGGSKSLWEEALDACLEPPEASMLKSGVGYHVDDDHESLVHPCAEHLSPLCTSCSDPVVGQMMGRTAIPYIKGGLVGCNLGGVWSGNVFVQPGSSSSEDILGEVRGRQLWEEDSKEDDSNACANRTGFVLGVGGQHNPGNVENGKNDGPPEGFSFALSHLDLRSLLTLERVSKSLREAVIGDALIWQHLNVLPPLSMSITDDVLINLAKRAEGHLKSLTLLECIRITSAGLEQVLSFSPELEKLCIPRCTGIKAEAIVRMVERHALESRSRGLSGIKLLRIKGVYNITRQQLDVLLGVLQHGRDQQELRKSYRPYYYRHGNYGIQRDLASDDERPIDVEPCPKCGNARVVYDCTRETCQQEKAHPGLTCRGCTLCIARCEECGTCVDDVLYEETFCLDLLCSACWYRLPKCTECNKPGCGRHAEDRFPGISFTCEDCCAGAAGPEFHAPADM
ncbi:hypothetical protein MPTK2_3g25210 [Marchantia polymorpha subsp. ruderalis]